MSDIFLSYATEDRAAAQKFVHALERQGWSVWWDRRVPAGKTYDDVIESQLETAKCVVVLWSNRSAGSRWVRTEADEAAERGVLVPILIDEAKIPLAFRRIQTANMVHWNGSDADPVFQQLVSDITAILGSPAAQPGADFDWIAASRLLGVYKPKPAVDHSRYRIRLYYTPTSRARSVAQQINDIATREGYQVSLQESAKPHGDVSFHINFRENQQDIAREIRSMLTGVTLRNKQLELEVSQTYITKDCFDIWIWE